MAEARHVAGAGRGNLSTASMIVRSHSETFARTARGSGTVRDRLLRTDTQTSLHTSHRTSATSGSAPLPAASVTRTENGRVTAP